MSNADLADFESKEKAVARPGMAGLIASALAWALILAILALVVPRFEAIFKDFGIDLSWSAKWLIRASHLWFVPTVVVAFILLVDYKCREELSKLKEGRGLLVVWSILMIGLPMLILASMILAIGSTLISLGSKLSG